MASYLDGPRYSLEELPETWQITIPGLAEMQAERIARENAREEQRQAEYYYRIQQIRATFVESTLVEVESYSPWWDLGSLPLENVEIMENIDDEVEPLPEEVNEEVTAPQIGEERIHAILKVLSLRFFYYFSLPESRGTIAPNISAEGIQLDTTLTHI